MPISVATIFKLCCLFLLFFGSMAHAETVKMKCKSTNDAGREFVNVYIVNSEKSTVNGAQWGIVDISSDTVVMQKNPEAPSDDRLPIMTIDRKSGTVTLEWSSYKEKGGRCNCF